jgi:phosphoglycerate dehydrogenase-like enzyme
MQSLQTKMSTGPLVHFETLSDRPRVFRMTPALIADAKTRGRVVVPTSFGEDLADLSWMPEARALVTHNDVLLNPKFPLYALARLAPGLRWIHVTGAGIEPLLPLDWLPPGAILTNNSGVHAEKIKESALMMLLMLNARLPEIATNQREAHWRPIFTPVIRGRTVLIIGVGDMGSAVAQAARQLELRVLGIRRSGSPHPAVDEMFRPNELEEALNRADFVVLAMPLTRETSRMLNRRRIQMMKVGAGLINIGRGGLIDHAALIDALNAGLLSGAILDVFEQEPLPPDSPLWKADKIIIMQHVTSDDEDEYLPKTLDLVFTNVQRLIAGSALLNAIDPRLGY